MQLLTSQIKYRYRLNKAGILLLDTTVKSGDPCFAPTWKMVLGHKAGTLSDETYTMLYKQKMQQSMRENKARWREVLMEEAPMALLCYCPYMRDGQRVFCHRHLLKDILHQLCEKYKLEFLYYGEYF